MLEKLWAIGGVSDKIVLGDKGFDSDRLRQQIKEGGGVSNIPGRKHRIKEVFYIEEVGKLRHVVKKHFSRIKRYQRVGTRYDRLVETYLSFAYLAILNGLGPIAILSTRLRSST